ncbi:hypothetical protein [Clostridium tarantellae]|uniref:BAH domain-containing protein n=1 Tax=Clostridium tarantellae TaxID=39493 RepID=A0A6I1MJG5_9CLOT|nr:hypothetical protein [Clostridium tarantellae]MPQ43666.1 hypothetical protein [Clostridium tarantellae]
MYINLYGENIENAVFIPVYFFKVCVFEDSLIESKVDVLGQTILEMLDVGMKLDIDYLSRSIGIPSKYRKLLEFEVDDLKDNGLITVNENNNIEEISEDYKSAAYYYALYDRVNNNLMDVFIKEELFEKSIRKNHKIDASKGYKLNFLTRSNIDAYDLSSKVDNLIKKINKVIDIDKDNFKVKEIDENEKKELELLKEGGLIPYNKIHFNFIDNFNLKEEGELLLKTIITPEGNIGYECPFTYNNKSLYIDRYIWNNVDEKRIKSLINIDCFNQLEVCEKKVALYLEEYKNFDSNLERVELFNQAVYYSKILECEGELYKNFQTPIIAYDKIAKGLLKDCIDKLGISSREGKEIILKDYIIKDEEICNVLTEYLIFNTIVNKKTKIIRKGSKLQNSIFVGSIGDYLYIIYLAPFFCENDYSKKVYKLFTEDERLINFLNDLWLYRNNTTHNVEDGRYYDLRYDMEIKHKERQLQEYNVLLEELFYFVEKLSEILMEE